MSIYNLINIRMPNYKDKAWFAVTISPQPFTGNTYYKYVNDLIYLKQIFKRSSMHYVFWPEFDKSDRLHYHGVVRVDNKHEWYKSTKRKLRIIGFTKIDLLKSFKDHLRWILYCKKDWGINGPHFRRVVDQWRTSRAQRREQICGSKEKRQRPTKNLRGSMKPKWRMNVSLDPKNTKLCFFN